jgi:Na+/phosphate symporter
MFKIIALLIAASGLYLMTFWAKENLKNTSLLWFALGMIITGLLIFSAITLYKLNSPGVGETFKNINENEIIKMRELLSIY